MFAGCADAADKAKKVAGWFAGYEVHQSHSLGIDREQAREQGVIIDDLEADQALQDAVLSVHHATMHTLNGPGIKIVENHLGRTFAKVQQQMVVPVPMMGPGPAGPMPGGGPIGIPGLPSQP